jgi:polar amino acid transport system substrate-binding protein
MNKKSAAFIVTFLLVAIVVFINNSNNKKQLTEHEIEWLKSQDAIIYAANENAPPLRFVDKIDNQYKGVVVDIVNLLSLELGTDIQTVPMKWDDALLSLKEGSTHLCDMFINKERSQNYLFTAPIYNLRTVLLTKTDENVEIEDINNMKISTELGDYANSYLTENYPGAELVYTSNVEEAFELFLEGEVNAVIGDEPIITFLLVEQNDSLNLEYSNMILYEEEVVFAVAKDKPMLVNILNKGIEQLKNKGQLEKIQQKWFGISTPLTFEANQSEIIRKIVITAIIIGCALILILLYNFQLQELVKKRTEELENSRNELTEYPNLCLLWIKIKMF